MSNSKKNLSGNAYQNVETQNETPKYHSPRNGEIVNGKIYYRMYDFNRDSWYNLIEKLTSKKWLKGDKTKFLPAIEKKLKERIRKGCCTQAQADALRMKRLSKLGCVPCETKIETKVKSETKTVIKIKKLKKLVININLN